MKTSRTNDAARCPACQKHLDAASDMRAASTPKPGDLSVCAYCSMLCTFNDDLTLRPMRADEFETLPPTVKQQLQQYQRAAALFASKRGERR